MPDASVACDIILTLLKEIRDDIASMQEDVTELKIDRAARDAQRSLAVGVGSIVLTFVGAVALWLANKFLWPILAKILGLSP